MAKKKDIPHFHEWKVIKEEFADHWRLLGNSHSPIMASPLMRVTRTQAINGLMHVVEVLEWGPAIRFNGSEKDMGTFLKNRFALTIAYQAQNELLVSLPKPKCRPTISLIAESDRQLKG